MPSPYELGAWVRKRYEMEGTCSLLRLIRWASGKAITKQESAGIVGADYEDAVEVVLFADGTGIMLQYTGGSPTYSSWTPGSPPATDYYLLTAKAPSDHA